MNLKSHFKSIASQVSPGITTPENVPSCLCVLIVSWNITVYVAISVALCVQHRYIATRQIVNVLATL